MPNISSFADIIRDWEQVLAAVQERADRLPNVEPHRLAVERFLAQAREAKARQESHIAQKQKASQDLQKIVTEGRKAVSLLRVVVKGNMGLETEDLVQFGIAPVRERRKRKPPEVEPPAATPPSPTGPGSQV